MMIISVIFVMILILINDMTMLIRKSTEIEIQAFHQKVKTFQETSPDHRQVTFSYRPASGGLGRF